MGVSVKKTGLRPSYDVEVAWQLNDVCDFHCVYCWCHKKRRKDGPGPIADHRLVVQGFERTGRTWLVHMSGGEPFLYPHFVELCNGLTKNHFISLNTNLTHGDVRAFARSIPPARVDYIHCSAHIVEREQRGLVNDFIEKYGMLRTRGFNVFASYLMYPALFDRYQKDYDYFKSRGVVLHPKVFCGCKPGPFKIFERGFFKKLKTMPGLEKTLRLCYPESYSAREREILKAYIEKSNIDDPILPHVTDAITLDVSADVHWLDALPVFKGKRCAAGVAFVKMDSRGNVYRCHEELQVRFGNILTGDVRFLSSAQPCISEVCRCPYAGHRYALR